jgi:hypothetical protein
MKEKVEKLLFLQARQEAITARIRAKRNNTLQE